METLKVNCDGLKISKNINVIPRNIFAKYTQLIDWLVQQKLNDFCKDCKLKSKIRWFNDVKEKKMKIKWYRKQNFSFDGF